MDNVADAADNSIAGSFLVLRSLFLLGNARFDIGGLVFQLCSILLCFHLQPDLFTECV